MPSPDENEKQPEPTLETTRAAQPADDPGLIAGRYRIGHVLGRGGGGTVWLARDEHLGREVALKRVAGETDAEVLVERGLREARTSAALAHDNVVRVFDAFEHEGSPWIVMEYVPGRSLAQLLEGGRSLPVPQVARIGAQLASALAAAHALGILHRDVKPANVLLDEDAQTAKLTDFGIARGEEDHQLTRTGMVSGTAAYFSPELARGQDPAAASDVWALGATLYTAVEGRRPFPDAANAVAQLHTIAREEPLEPLRAGPLTPVLAGMLHDDPTRRWDAGRAARELGRVAAGGDSTATTTEQQVWGSAPTQQQAPVDSTRVVPVAQPRGYARERHAAPAAPHTPSRTAHAAPLTTTRRRSGVGAVLTWLVAIPLLALLGWLVWTVVGQGDGPGDGTSQTSTAPGASGEVTEAEANEFVRGFYQTLVRDGLDAARAKLGPDADVDPGITDGLTRIDYGNSVTTAGDDGAQQVAIDVTYNYGSTTYAQRETLLVAREDGQLKIVERSTTEPVITRPDEGDQGDGQTDDAGSGNNGNGNGRGNNGNGNNGDD